MKNLTRISNVHGDSKVIDACCLFGMMDTSGKCFSGRDVTRAIANMHDRGNGLGGGFAVYGLYPQYPDYYAFHIMYDSKEGKTCTEAFLNEHFNVHHSEEVPTRPVAAIKNPPMVWRYFLDADKCQREGKLSPDDYVVARVMDINAGIDDAYVFSSGKNMAAFKGVGYPEEISEYFCLENYNGYLWTAHGRFPTNTKGWWGGAHPFNILDWTVVHNGEISSYGINKRYLEQFGYHCTLQTDTEVLAYAVDLLVRKHNMPIEVVAEIFAPPLWEEIERRPVKERELLKALRQVYASLLMNGPFTVILAHEGEMIGLTDRIRLRPLTVGEKGSMLYLSSEEAAIRLVCPELDKAWIPMGVEPVIGSLKHPLSANKVPVAGGVA